MASFALCFHMARSASPCVRTKQHKHTWSELTVRVGQLVGGHHPEFGRAGRRDCHRLELLHYHLVDHVRRAGRFGRERSRGLVGLQSGGGFDLPRLVVDNDGDRFFVVGVQGRRGSRLVVAELAQLFMMMSIGKSISHRRRRLVEIPRRGDAGALPTEYADDQPHQHDGKPDGGGGHHGSAVIWSASVRLRAAC